MIYSNILKGVYSRKLCLYLNYDIKMKLFMTTNYFYIQFRNKSNDLMQI